MAPSTSFVRISPHSVISLRIFTNRKEIIKQNQSPLFEAAISSAITKSHRAIVRLRSASSIHLSNKQIKQLVEDLKEKLLSFLFKDSIDILELQREKITNKQINKDKDIIKIIVNENGWKVRIYLSLKFIQSLRNGMIKFEYDDNNVNLLIRRPKELSKGTEEPIILREEDDELVIPNEDEVVVQNDTKQVQKYEYKKTNVLGSIKIEILQLPKKV